MAEDTKSYKKSSKTPADSSDNTNANSGAAGGADNDDARVREVGGRDGPDPTRYGDWEKNGRCIDF